MDFRSGSLFRNEPSVSAAVGQEASTSFSSILIEKSLGIGGQESQTYESARRFLLLGDLESGRALLERLLKSDSDPRRQAIYRNDLGVAFALNNQLAEAWRQLSIARDLAPESQLIRKNFAAVEDTSCVAHRAVRIAVVSFLFNWPSTGGGNIHTAELVHFLMRAGFEVLHVFAVNSRWGIGDVSDSLPYRFVSLRFEDSNWNLTSIQDRYREAVDEFDPDFVLITDSWNFKVHLADALKNHAYFLRLQALECLCPLNNVRLLFDSNGGVEQCPKNQFATPTACCDCLRIRGESSGLLHRWERQLSGVESADYHEKLLRVFECAEGVVVINPWAASMIEPYARAVHVVPPGMDPARFPRHNEDDVKPPDKVRLLFAGLVGEGMKGFHVVEAACRRLWGERQDFELIVTGDPVGRPCEFARFIGWQSQSDLVSWLQRIDILVFPTIAQEAFGRSAVEAMACGKAVIASRIGGIPFTVIDGATGILCEPNDVPDLAAAIGRLLDDPSERVRLGRAGRARFETHYAWPTVVDKHYRPLFAKGSRRFR